MKRIAIIVLLILVGCNTFQVQKVPQKPNIVLIYADDLGYGDVGVYGGTIPTQNIDRLADCGILHQNAYATASTCTPSRYSMIVGEYAWRKTGRGVINGDVQALIPSGSQTIASVFKKAGYQTAVVGKWHLGLGNGQIDWNTRIPNSPNDVGFDYSFIMPATADRVPCVYVENGNVVNLDKNDPISVDYNKKIGDFPIGKESPELLKLKYSHGHDMTIINGISRIGYQSGGKSALWNDENLADDFVEKSVKFIEDNKKNPFFLYLATNNIHVPRMPHPRFQNKTKQGLRGDAIVELDAMVGAIVKKLDSLHLLENTIIIFSSDNGAVLDDGYADKAIELNDNHNPFSKFRGGKYSLYEAGTRVPFIVSWKGKINKQYSTALVSQVDLLSSIAKFLNIEVDKNQAMDSQDQWSTWIGQNKNGREFIVQEGLRNQISIIKGNYKYIPPITLKNKVAWQTGIETGFDSLPQLYNLEKDISERENIASQNPKKVQELQIQLNKIKNRK